MMDITDGLLLEVVVGLVITMVIAFLSFKKCMERVEG